MNGIVYENARHWNTMSLFVSWSLLSSTQTDDADVLGTRVLAWLHYRISALTQLLVSIAQT